MHPNAPSAPLSEDPFVNKDTTEGSSMLLAALQDGFAVRENSCTNALQSGHPLVVDLLGCSGALPGVSCESTGDQLLQCDTYDVGMMLRHCGIRKHKREYPCEHETNDF